MPGWSRNTKLQAAAKPPLQALHLSVVGLMIIPCEMQHSVQNEHAQLRRQPAREAPRVSPRGLRSDGNVAAVRPSGVAGTSACAFPSAARAPRMCRREREHIGGTAFAAEFPVEARHGRI